MSSPAPAARLGRPRIYPAERCSDYVTITMTPSQRRALEAHARQAGKALTAYTRELLAGAIAPDQLPHTA